MSDTPSTNTFDFDAMERLRAERARAAGVPVPVPGEAPPAVAGPPPGAHVAKANEALKAINVDTADAPNYGADIPAEVPEDDVPALKARALRASGTDEIRDVVVQDIGHPFVLRRPTRAEFMEYLNKAFDAKQSSDGEWNLVLACTIWPNQTALRAARSELPALPKRLVDKLDEWCGGATANVISIELTRATTEDQLSDPYGLTMDDVVPLMQRYPSKNGKRAALRVVGCRTSPEGQEDADVETVVVKSPSLHQYNTLVSGFRAGDKAEAFYDAAMSCIVWPEAEADRREIVDRAPGLPYVLFPVLSEMGGAGARTTAKKR